MPAAIRWFVVALFATSCAAELDSTGGPPGSRTEVDAGGRADGGQSDKADAGAPDTTPATVNAEPCLFVRMGPGTDRPKVSCAGGGPECTDGGELCIPTGQSVTVTGPAESGPGCDPWYPLDFADYQGYGCGMFLDLGVK